MVSRQHVPTVPLEKLMDLLQRAALTLDLHQPEKRLGVLDVTSRPASVGILATRSGPCRYFPDATGLL